MRPHVFSLTPTEQAIVDLLAEGWRKKDLTHLAGPTLINSAAAKARAIAAIEADKEKHGRTSMKTAHGRKMAPFVK